MRYLFFVNLLLIFSSCFVMAAGSFTIESDPMMSPYKAVSAGDSNVIIGVLRLRASGENINLFQIEFTMTSGFPNSLVSRRVRVYDGVTLVGVAQFADNNANSHITATVGNLLITTITDKLLTLRADISPIGQGQLGIEGSLIKVDVRKNVDLPPPNGFSAVGQGQTSGEFIYTESITNFSGVRTFKSTPIFALDPLAANGLGDGKLLRFKVSAGSNGSIGVGKFTLMFATPTQNITVNNVNMFGFTDAQYTQPISGVSLDGRLRVAGQIPNSSNEVNIFPQNGEGSQTTIQISAGTTYYFEVRGNVVANGTGIKNVITTICGDLAFNQGGVMTTIAGVESDPNNNFIWSPNFAGISLPTNTDWSNGAGLSGLPAAGLSQSRTDDSQPLVLTVSATPSPAQVGAQVLWRVNVEGGTGVNSYEWQGSDGLYGSGQSSNSIIYTSPGAKYGIVTVISGTQVKSAGMSLMVNTPQDPPITLSMIKVNPNPSLINQNVNFSVTAGGGNGVYAYSWLIDGNLVGGNTANHEQSFTTSGIRSVAVKVVSGNAESRFVTGYIEVKDPPILPLVISVITAEPQMPYLNDVVTFSINAPVGGNGNYTFAWVIDGIAAQGNGDGASMSHTFTTLGTKRIDLTVTSGSQSATTSLLIKINEIPTSPPITNISITAPIKIAAGQLFSWRFTTMDSSALYSVNWGDNSPIEQSLNGVFTHVYTSVGSYIPIFSIISDGVTTNLAYNVIVENAITIAPSIFLTGIDWGNTDAVFVVAKNGMITYAIENPVSKLFYQIRSRTGDKPYGTIRYKLKNKKQYVGVTGISVFQK